MEGKRMRGKKVKRTQINTYRKGINTGMNCHHVLEINQHKCHCWCRDSVNKHRFLRSECHQSPHSIDIHIPPVLNKQGNGRKNGEKERKRERNISNT